MKVWDFEFRLLLFVCYLGFVICNFNQLPRLRVVSLLPYAFSNSQFAIRNSKCLDSMPHALCPLPPHLVSLISLELFLA